MQPSERILHVGPQLKAPRLTVATPFFKHDPSPLIESLGTGRGNVELLLLDDGSASATLLSDVISACERSGASARVIVWGDNRGRAAARNRLIQEARGEYVLFLDADMIPDSTRFLDAWLGIIQTQRPFIAFGGLSVAHATPSRDTALHHHLFAASDCRSARQRARRPAQSIATANLLVHRDVLQDHPFDASYVGWGFEDVDWALSAARRTPILHVDNTASHAGLDNVDALMRKSVEAGPNFARLAAKHPQQVSRFAAHRAARVLRLTPLRTALRQFCAWLARDPIGAAPMAMRRAAFKLYRVSVYAEHLA